MINQQKTFYEQEIERIATQNFLRSDLYGRVRNSKHFMEHGLAEKISLREIAGNASLSRFHFIRIFQQVYGVSPRLFLRDLRVAKAKELLKSGFSVTQTCHEVGYESLTTFSSTFKRCTGLSPVKYREMNVRNRE